VKERRDAASAEECSHRKLVGRLPLADDRERDSESTFHRRAGRRNHLPRVVRIAQAIL
jgi:hypothetical protein